MFYTFHYIYSRNPFHNSYSTSTNQNILNGHFNSGKAMAIIMVIRMIPSHQNYLSVQLLPRSVYFFLNNRGNNSWFLKYFYFKISYSDFLFQRFCLKASYLKRPLPQYKAGFILLNQRLSETVTNVTV